MRCWPAVWSDQRPRGAPHPGWALGLETWGPGLGTPAPAAHWMWAAAGEGECLGGGSPLRVRKSKCPVSPVITVLAEGLPIKTCQFQSG